MIRTLLFIGIFLFTNSLSAQEVRNIDGSANNLLHPEWGAVHSPILRITSNGYSDSISVPAGLNRPNPRHISNVLFAQSELINDPLGLSDFAWVFGQFIDHDITLIHDSEDPSDFMPIRVPMGDTHFDPMGTGEVMIPLMRNAADPTSGNTTQYPRTTSNDISAFIDGSGVYGSDDFRAFWVRSLQDGKLKMTTDNLLPFNTQGGELQAPIDIDAPEMAMENPFAKNWFIAGDVRANENTLLLSLHTLFAREHNRLCADLKTANPSWTDEQLFQTAKRQVSGMIQAIVYEEWLPTLGITLPAYQGYDATVNPNISNVFSAAAFRYGHTTINSNIVRMGNDGHIMEEGNTILKEIFFNPMTLMEAGGMEALLKGMSTQVQQDLDCKIIDDLRNFLFGPPGAGGLDLAAINIQRGRERGLADYNTIRQDVGLPTVSNTQEITSDPAVAATLATLYENINDIDPWVGLLAEDHLPNALFGETTHRIVTEQFQRLRDGDRFYYEIDPLLSLEDIQTIKSTRLADIIRRNFDITIHDDVFIARPPEQLSTSVAEIVIEDRFTLAPNPTDAATTLSFAAKEKGAANISVYNAVGQVVHAQEVAVQVGDNQFSIALEQQQNGIYFVRLAFVEGVISAQLLLQR